MPSAPPFSSAGLPARAALDGNGLRVALLDIPVAELKDPFVPDTVKRMPEAAQALAQVPLARLGQVPAATAPAGLIFHVARCGSTLASQLLKEHEGVVVYSEPLAINEVLVPPHRVPRGQLVAALRSLGALFAAHASGPYVVKLTSWNTLFCDLLAEAFPGTPWALCVRDPLPVCVSLLRQRPGWLRGDFGSLFTGLVDPGGHARNDEERVARVYAGFCEAIDRIDAARGMLVTYEALPAAVWEALGPHFGLGADDATRRRMAQAAGTHAKSPVGRPAAFVPDEADKRGAASPELARAVEAVARPAYVRLLDRWGAGAA